MEDEVKVNGVNVASGVVATIVSMAAAEVEGVVGVGPAGAIPSSLRAVLSGKAAMPSMSGIEAETLEDGRMRIAVSVQVEYGYKIVDVAANVRTAVANAVSSQIGVEVAAVDVNVDGMAFNEKKSAS